MSPKDERVVQHVSGQSNKPMSNVAHALERDAITQELITDARNGLTVAEAAKRLEEYGRNELDNGPGVQPFKILLRQIANAMMLVECPMVEDQQIAIVLIPPAGPNHRHGCLSCHSVLDRRWCHRRCRYIKHRRRLL
jgi:hypothetical protein